jgi:cytochrome c oxidase subunit 4
MNHEHQVVPLRTYFAIYIALLVLLVLTVAVAFLEWGPWGVIAALAIAVVKMLLVMLYFMHLRQNEPLVWLFAGAGFVWLGILLVLMISDYLSRSWVGN